jgi:hypothetical protein
VALLEIAVGLLVLLGLKLRGAAAASGLALNLILFLTASWKTYPYFLGSDIVFVFGWLALGLAVRPASRRSAIGSSGGPNRLRGVTSSLCRPGGSPPERGRDTSPTVP